MSSVLSLRGVKLLGVILTFICLAVGTAKADGVTINYGNNPQADEENILLTGGDTGNPIYGFTNQSEVQVRFTSNENLLSPPQGQARIVAADGTLNYLMIDVPNGSFGDLILNINAFEDGTVRFRITTNQGVLPDELRDVDDSGQNFFTILASGNTRIFSVEFWCDEGMLIQNIDDVHQVRISGVEGGNPVPEPTSLLFLGSGLLGVAGALRQRSRKSKTHLPKSS